MSRTIAALLILLSLFVVLPATAGDLPDWLQNLKVSGLMFGDGYWLAKSADPSLDASTGVWLRRVYLTFDEKLADDFSARLRFEMNSAGDFKSTGNITPYTKDAWIKWTRKPNQEFIVGMQSTPTWENADKRWGYRDVEKTPVDLYRLGSSRDTGFGFRGSASDGKVQYHFLIGNGSGTGSETNQGKKAGLSVIYNFTKKSQLEVYGDYEDRTSNTDRITGFTMFTWRAEKATAGALYVRQVRQTDHADSTSIDVASVWGTMRLGSKLDGILRVDYVMDPIPDASSIPYIPWAPNAKGTLVLAGVSYELRKNVRVIPNVEAVFFDGVNGSDPDNDLMARLTFSCTF